VWWFYGTYVIHTIKEHLSPIYISPSTCIHTHTHTYIHTPVIKSCVAATIGSPFRGVTRFEVTPIRVAASALASSVCVCVCVCVCVINVCVITFLNYRERERERVCEI
jgi:hypothetical protein